MKIYVTTDTHFNHMKLVDIFHARPADFQEQILSSHSKIGDDDLLIHLGDFCIGKDLESHNRWNAATGHIRNRILVRGNHDNKSDEWYMNHGWNCVADGLLMTVRGKSVYFTHIPIPDFRAPLGTEFNIHGHTHGDVHRDKDIEDYNPQFNIEIAMEKTDNNPILITDKFFQIAKGK
jgi:calcineurin-like phosphoesterase family protein